MTVTRKYDGSLITSVYRKPIHSGRYLPFDSHHPLSQNLSIPRTLFNRADNVTLDKTLKQKEFRTIEATSKTNGYPRKFFNRRLMKKKQMDNNEKPTITTSLPYVQGVTEPIKRVLQQIGVGVAMKPIFSLSSKFLKPKDCVLDHEKSGLVYQISCWDRDAVYIGETGRSITTRKREDVDAVKDLDVKKSALCQHVVNKDNVIDWGNVEVLKRDSHWHRRGVAEGFLINQKALSMNVLNRNDGMIVPSVYNELQKCVVKDIL